MRSQLRSFGAAVLAAFFCFVQPALAVTQGGGAVSGSAASPVNFAASTLKVCPFTTPGDSLTQGADGQNGYPTYLAQLTGCQVYNNGIGGQTSTQIAQRQGAVAFTLTIGSNTLSSGSNSVTNINGSAVAGCNTNCLGQPLSTSSGNGANVMFGTLCGSHGVLSRTGSGGPPSTSETYVFVPDSSAGLPTACGPAAAFTTDASAQAYGQSFWAGFNNVTSQSTVESDIAAMVATSTTKNYDVLSILTADYNPSGSSTYNAVIAVNAVLAATYGSNYMEVRKYLVANYNPANIVDAYQIAQGLDVTPYSLHATAGTGTLSGSINNSTCAITLSSTVDQGGIVLIDSEYILVTTSSGSVISACTRGYAGSTAASHTNGAAYTASDPVHLTNAAELLVATYVFQHAPFLTNVSTQGSSSKNTVPQFSPPGDPTSVGFGSGALSSLQGTASYLTTAGGNNSLQSFVGSTITQFGSQDTAWGALSLQSCTGCYHSTAIGYDALNKLTTNGNNTAVGNIALFNATGSNVTALGYNAGEHATSGSSNLFLGSSVGSATITSGADDILIGIGASGAGGADVVSGGDSHKLVIGNILFESLVSAAAPAVSSCGTESIDANANNATGQVNITGGSPAACTITFAGSTPYQTWIHCVVTAESGETGSVNVGFNYSYSTSAITLGATALSGNFDYSCQGY